MNCTMDFHYKGLKVPSNRECFLRQTWSVLPTLSAHRVKPQTLPTLNAIELGCGDLIGLTIHFDSKSGLRFVRSLSNGRAKFWTTFQSSIFSNGEFFTQIFAFQVDSLLSENFKSFVIYWRVAPYVSKSIYEESF